MQAHFHELIDNAVGANAAVVEMGAAELGPDGAPARLVIKDLGVGCFGVWTGLLWGLDGPALLGV
jgi:hypothetical protein